MPIDNGGSFHSFLVDSSSCSSGRRVVVVVAVDSVGLVVAILEWTTPIHRIVGCQTLNTGS